MSTPEESPAQKAARMRRERRDAKLKDGGAARLDKITSMGGRTPASVRESQSASPSPSPQPSTIESAPRPEPATQEPSPENLQAQQEYVRALLRQPAPSEQQQQQQQQQLQQPGPEEEDPAVKLLHSILAGGGVDGSMPGGGGDQQGGATGPSQADLLSALGLPPILSSMVGAAAQPKSEADKKETQLWKTVHVVFAIVTAVYLLIVIGASTATYGGSPPPPATVQNPFLVFTTGELVLSSARMVMKSRDGGGLVRPGVWAEMVRDAVRDGSLVVFVLGLGTWWHQG